MGLPQVTKMYNEEKVYSIRSLVVNFQRALFESSEYVPQLKILHCIIVPHFSFVTWGWLTVAETCRQPNKTDTKTVVFWRTYTLLICIKHNMDDAAKEHNFCLELKSPVESLAFGIWRFAIWKKSTDTSQKFSIFLEERKNVFLKKNGKILPDYIFHIL